MKKIKLQKSTLVTLVDAEDFIVASKYRWYLQPRGNYAAGYLIGDPKCKRISLHRLLMNPPKGKVVDHINHNGLDNRRSNLRICTYSQNQMNSFKRKGMTSTYKGVSWHKHNKKWQACIKKNGKLIGLGRFDSEKLAYLTYCKAAKELFGEFANY